MAMNKKEAAELAEAKRQALVNRALRWTDGAKRDLHPPKHGEDYTQGFDYNSYNLSVYDAWSCCVYHGSGIREEGKRPSSSQNAISLFSTESLALKAMRADVEMEAAVKLAKIDAKIAELSAEGK